MHSFYIEHQRIPEAFGVPNIRAKYLHLSQSLLDKNSLYFAQVSVGGLFIYNRDLYISDSSAFEKMLAACREEFVVARSFNRKRELLFLYFKEPGALSLSRCQDLSSACDTIEEFYKVLSGNFTFVEKQLDETVVYLIDDLLKLSDLARNLNRERLRNFMQNGVYIEDPDSVWIHEEVRIEPGVCIASNVVIRGATVIFKDTEIDRHVEINNSVIGSSCRIDAFSYIEDSRIGNSVHVMSSRIVESKVGDACNIGPFAHLRPKSDLADAVKVGNFVEVKNSKVGEGTKMSHLSYIGDSDLGKKINVGCGVIFVNYNGKEKFRSKIDDGAFIGCNTNIVSPVHIGEDAFIAAGSTITEDVEADQLAIARSRQVNKDGWKLKK